MGMENIHFEKKGCIQELKKCGRVYQHMEEPLIVAELHGDFDEGMENVDFEFLRKRYNCQYMLFVAEQKEEISLLFSSGTKQVRALEFLDSLIPEFGLVRGNAKCARGQISTVILKVKMADEDISEGLEYFLKQADAYFTGCDCIVAETYGKRHKNEIVNWQRYEKRKEGWAFVKSLDVTEKGQQIQIKTLENESGMLLTANEDVYIMIGCRGEVYDMKREKFEATYEATAEPFDVFERMPDFIPAVENAATGEYISLDEMAHICYPKPGAGIYARRLTKRTKIFPTGSNQEYFHGRPGDYMAVRVDDLCDSYIIEAEVFERTYEPVLVSSKE